MRKKTVLILVVCILALVLVAAWYLLYPIPLKYEKNIARNIDNQEENVLTVAESINYSAIVSFERFHGSSDPQAYLNSSKYLEYTYANFIDSDV